LPYKIARFDTSFGHPDEIPMLFTANDLA